MQFTVTALTLLATLSSIAALPYNLPMPLAKALDHSNSASHAYTYKQVARAHKRDVDLHEVGRAIEHAMEQRGTWDYLKRASTDGVDLEMLARNVAPSAARFHSFGTEGHTDLAQRQRQRERDETVGLAQLADSMQAGIAESPVTTSTNQERSPEPNELVPAADALSYLVAINSTSGEVVQPTSSEGAGADTSAGAGDAAPSQDVPETENLAVVDDG